MGLIRYAELIEANQSVSFKASPDLPELRAPQSGGGGTPA